MPFNTLGLSDRLVQGILATGYSAPTAIQSKAIPLAVAGHDIIGIAQTGTGKTAAFTLPILHRLTQGEISHKSRHVRALVLVPTRELAQQVDEFVSQYGRFTTIQSLAIYGGVSMENQIKRLHRGIDIVVATPGRLLDHINRKTVDLSHVEILVLDEADRMFDMGFIQDVRTIVGRTQQQNRQTLLFSATMSKEVKDLVGSIQKHPHTIQIGEQQKPVDTVTQLFVNVPQDQKIELLLHILRTQTLDSVLVFSRTKHGADRIAKRLERAGVRSVALHSDRTQAQRQRALAGFKQGQFKVLVATDIAARGIDVEGISHVINYDTPSFAEDYVHRIGRTGRASATGDAITFVSNEERKNLKGIERFVGRTYDLRRYEGFDYTKRQPAPEKTDTGHREEPRREEHRDRDRKPEFRKRNDRKSEGHRSERRSEHTSEHRSEHKPMARTDRKPHGETRGREERPQHSFSKQNERTPNFKNKNDRRNTRIEGKQQFRDDNKRNDRRGPHKDDTFKKKSDEQKKEKFPITEKDWQKVVEEISENGGLTKKLRRWFVKK
jgi:ATP-dependent RNA helicase RhlE